MNRLISIALVCLLQVSLAVASTFNLRVEVTPDGASSLNTSGGTYEEGSKVNLRTYANTGYVFKGWYEGETLLSSSTSFSYTMPSNDALVQARYEYDPAVPGNPAMPDTTTYYSLTAIVSPVGAGSLNTYSGKYAAGASVNMRTYNNTGYQFVGWQNEMGENLSTSTSFNYTMPRHDAQLTALYVYDPTVPANPDSMATRYTVTVDCKPVGGGTFNTWSASAEEGGNVHLYAYTNTGYRFLRWEDEVGETISTAQNFYYVIPHGNSKVYGVFEFDPAVPGNPNKNYWNKDLGEAIIDDFTPGNLGSAVLSVISGSNRNDVAMITVAGKMNDNDFGIANDYSNCTLLDLSRVTGITAVPSYAFDYTNLESVYLPATIEKIGYRAFYECKQLSSLIVYAMMPPVLENNVFTNVPEGLVVYVPAAAIAQYQEAAGWKEFTILPIQEDIRCISISLPEGANAADYAQMWLELTNTKSGQRMHYVMTDRLIYTFANIIRNTSWNVTLRNERGDVFGQIDNVEVKDEDVSVAFSSLSKPQSVVLSVLTPDGQDVTAQTQVTWTDAQGNYLAQGVSLTGLPTGYQTAYRIVLSQELAMAYNTPQPVDYVLTDGNNRITCQLNAIPQIKISGKVKDASSGLPLNGAVVSASQTFGGKYSKTLNAKTDGNGIFTLNIANVPTSVAFAASDYVSQTINCDSLLTGVVEVSLPDVSLKTITGATITLGFTYTSCDGETQNWYSDYQNVSYELFNVTKNKAVSQYNVQYPQIVLLEEIADGDVLRLTATSRTNAFMPVTATATIAEQKAETTFAVVELGKIQSSFTTTGNATVVGSLYDSAGKLVKTYDYSNASLTINDLADGNYTLVSMGNSRLFNTIYDLSQLPQTGLVEGTDYVLNAVEVKSGAVSQISIDEVPTLDESKLYYTGDNTSFTVNKPSIVAGNYLTLTGRIDFKPAYATSVSNVQMIVDLPESCEFVENSVMVGNSTSSYTLNGNRITIPMTRYTDRVRFCIIPTLGGEYAPSAFVQFDLDGQTITQPIGSANYTAKNLSISVPSTVAKTSVPISGTAIGTSTVEIYDNDVLVGQTTSLANGTWATTCELNEASNMSVHTINARIRNKSGIELLSESVECQYNKYAIEVKTVTMINTAHTASNLDLHEYVTIFDFQNPPNSIPAYWYWPSYPEFTFFIDFTNNDSTMIKDIVLNVFTDDNKIVHLYPKYDANKGLFVTSAIFNSYSLPCNVSVDYKNDFNGDIDMNYILSCLPDRVKNGGYKTIINTEQEKSFLLVDIYGKPLFFHNILYGIFDKSDMKSKLEGFGAELFVETDSTIIYTYNENSTVWLNNRDQSSRVDAFIIPEEMEFWQNLCNDIFVGSLTHSKKLIRKAVEDPFKPEITDPLGWLRDWPLRDLLAEARRKYPCNDQETLKLAVSYLRQGCVTLGASAVSSTIATTSSITGGDVYGSVSNGMGFGGGTDGTMNNANYWKNYIHSLEECDGGGPTGGAAPVTPDVPNVKDPSGFVYEGVASNRVEGATATIFYKEMVEDMYGDLHENIVKWDATDYAQENPLFTDEDGGYAWDVPNGLWQVKFEKEGYETTYSEWLPVPPPQLDVNIPMKQNVQPNVKLARAYEDAVEVEFDKYMMSELLTTDNIIVMQGNEAVAGSVELLNNEVSYEGSNETFASKIRFNAAQPFTEQEVTLMVNNRVKSYAGIRMQDDYQQKFTVEQEIKQIAADSVITVGYGNASTLFVTVLPASASKGKTLTVRTSSPMILGVETEQVTIGNDGKAEIAVNGELPGTAALTFSVEGTDKTAMTIANVEQIVIKTVATPKASIASGTVVEKGTAITLTCETEGAIIYYTLDGSCPCDNTDSRKVYDGTSIIVNETVTIKAMAVAPNMYESDVVEFTYIVDGAAGINEVTLNDEIQVYPLPVRDILNVTANGKIIKSVTVSSMNGVLVASANKAATKVTLNVSTMPTGIYITNVVTESGSYSRKILKVD